MTSRPRPLASLALVGLLAVAAILPAILSNFRLFQFTQVFIYAIALLGLNVLTGYNGQISLGHGAFYALGAYTGAIMSRASTSRSPRSRWRWPCRRS